MAAHIDTRQTETDDVVPVAPASAIRHVSLTRIEERNGEWIYGDEVELSEVPHAPRELRVDKPEGGTRLEGQLVCREIIAGKGKPVDENDYAVLCFFPYYMDWYSWSAFKPGTHKKTDATKKDLADDPEPGHILEKCKFDPFETSTGERLTARFVEYARTKGLRISNRDRRANGACDLHSSSPRERFSQDEEKQHWLYGIVNGDFDDTVSKILNSPACVDLLSRGTEEQILFSGEKNNVPRLMLSDREYYLFAGHCPVILDASVRKALAGLPPREYSAGFWKDDEPRRVTVLVEEIFSKALRALAKRLSSVPVKEVELRPGRRSPDEPPPRQNLEELIDRTQALLQHLLSGSVKEAPAVTLPMLWEVSRSSLKQPEPEQGLLIAIALYRLGFQVPDNIHPLTKAATDRHADAAAVSEEISKPRAAKAAGKG